MTGTIHRPLALLAYARITDRHDASGHNRLFIEEIQSSSSRANEGWLVGSMKTLPPLVICRSGPISGEGAGTAVSSATEREPMMRTHGVLIFKTHLDNERSERPCLAIPRLHDTLLPSVSLQSCPVTDMVTTRSFA